MPRRSISEFGRDQAGAVAATYAIAIPMLIGVAGVGLDYGRMVALDTELQNAADQAALAGATQLDGTAGSMERAMAAAQGGLVTNFTRVANDGDTPAVDVPGASIVFYQTRPDAESKANGFTDVTRYEDAHFVQLSVETRAARYALTPLIGAFGATLAAQATSGLGSAICKVPPVMICNPEEPIGNADTELLFDADSRVGVGILMVSNDSYTPGSFGYLQTGANGTNALAAAIGWDNRPGDCVSLDGVELKDGVNASVIDAFNTRFDVPGSGNSCVSYGGINGTCSPSVNVRKDMVRGNACTANAWQQNAANAATSLTHNYRPTSRALYPAGTTPDIMGHPRDLCHAWSKTGDCNAVNGGKGARVGTGDWDINAYWRSNYGANYANQVSTTYGPQPKGYPTRYAVYRWEAENIAAGTLSGVIKNAQGSTKAYAQPQAGKCLATASSPYGIVPGGANVDRRRISAAVLNCRALQTKYGSINNKTLETAGFVDMFMVEPSVERQRCDTGAGGCGTDYSDKTDVYVEIIGKTGTGRAGPTVGQVVRRDVPYLVR